MLGFTFQRGQFKFAASGTGSIRPDEVPGACQKFESARGFDSVPSGSVKSPAHGSTSIYPVFPAVCKINARLRGLKTL
jgi:hypothetical protein